MLGHVRDVAAVLDDAVVNCEFEERCGGALGRSMGLRGMVFDLREAFDRR